MNKVTVDLQKPSFYAEADSKFYRFKRRLTYKSILRIIRKAFKKDQKFSLLEVGTGSGFFITFMEMEFPNARLTGIEYDPRLVGLTQKKVRNAEIMQGNAESFSFENIKFDIIVSFQVIEHLYYPEKMIECVKESLREGGLFVFTTPNLSGLGATIMKDKWHGYREDHVSLKGYDDWKVMLEKHGFDVIYTGSTFFSGIPFLNKFPLGFLNWGLLFTLGHLRWKKGESFIGVFKLKKKNEK
ncbi:MAG: class I SAM-dependent methyltransferase [Bacteroidota bacterium]|nr:class I SAM-dependent methyltransferase [Bacteroidota bacterium]